MDGSINLGCKHIAQCIRLHLNEQLILQNKCTVANTTNRWEILDRIADRLYRVTFGYIHGVNSDNGAQVFHLLKPELVDLCSATGEDDVLGAVLDHPTTERATKV